MSKIKLIHIISGLEVGGAERFLLRLVTGLRDGYEMEVISLSSNGPIGAELEKLGVPVTALGMGRAWPSLSKFLRLVRILRHARPGIVHNWMYHADFLGGLAARLAGVRVVIWGIRQSNLSPEANRGSTLMVARACAFLSSWVPDRIVCVAEAARQAHVRFGYSGDRMLVIPNGFNIASFRPDPQARASVRQELGLSDSVPLAGVIARFDVQKGYAIFADVAARLKQLLPQARFLLVGKGVSAENAQLMEWLRARDLQDNVILLGYRPDVARLLASLDVLLLPSVGEGLPNVVGEAMAAGVPCVATNVGDTAQLVGDAGIVANSSDIEGLAQGLARLLAMPPDERAVLSQNARQHIAQHYEISTVMQRYDTLYRSLADAD